MSNSTRVRSTKKYKALIEAGLSEPQALGVLGVQATQPSPLDNLVAAGFTPDQAAGILSGQFLTATPVAQAVQAAEPVQVTSKDLADALVAQRGLAHGKGRVYANTALVEAQARVLKGGKPEIVQTSGAGRTPAVLVFRTDTGDAAIQNLYDPAKA